MLAITQEQRTRLLKKLKREGFDNARVIFERRDGVVTFGITATFKGQEYESCISSAEDERQEIFVRKLELIEHTIEAPPLTVARA